MSECLGCTKGVTMCRQSPCHGTVDDMSRLIDAGYLSNISLQVGICIDEGRYISALIPSYENLGGHIHYNRLPHGPCSLLEDDRCSIHHMKPLLGKVSCCKDIGHDGELYTQTRTIIKDSWKKEGNLLVKRWGEYWGCSELVERILDFGTCTPEKEALRGAIDNYNTHAQKI